MSQLLHRIYKQLLCIWQNRTHSACMSLADVSFPSNYSNFSTFMSCCSKSSMRAPRMMSTKYAFIFWCFVRCQRRNHNSNNHEMRFLVCDMTRLFVLFRSFGHLFAFLIHYTEILMASDNSYAWMKLPFVILSLGM